MTKYLDLSIKEINELLKSKKIKPIDLVMESLDRIEGYKEYNSLITVDKESAIKSACELENKEVDNILFGIPIVIKDNICTKYIKTTCGSKMLSNFITLYDASVIENIKDKNMKDITIYNKVINNFMVQKSNLILIYVSTRGEIDTNLLIKYFLDNNKKVAIPKVNGNNMDFYYISDISEMSIGYKGIYEPITNKKVTNFTSCVSITPGICFSKNNYRIGYGKGFYDKFYKKHNVYKIGLCYKECLVDSFNIDKFDIKVDEIITN